MTTTINLIDDDATNDVADNQHDDANKGGAAEAEDRGDNLEPEVSQESLKSLVKSAPVDDEDLPNQSHGISIPKARFDAVNNKAKEAERQLEIANAELATLRAGKPPANAAAPQVEQPAATQPEALNNVSLRALRKEYHQALMDGDTDKAEELTDKIDAQVIAIAEYRVEQRQASKAVANSMAEVTTQALKDYPFLDTPAGADALDAIIAGRDRRIQGGMGAVQALSEAVSAIAPRFAGEQDANQVQGLESKKGLTDTRTSNAVARGARDSNSQPASLLAGQGNRTTASRPLNGEDMTEEQFSNMTQAEKKAARGD